MITAKLLDEPEAFRSRVISLHQSYCHYVDAHDISGLMSLFDEDAEIDFGIDFFAKGSVDLCKLLTKLVNSCANTSHHVSNIMCNVTEMSGIAYVMAWHRFHNLDQSDLVVYGRYTDSYIIKDGNLRIRSRVLFVHGATTPVPFNMFIREST